MGIDINNNNALTGNNVGIPTEVLRAAFGFAATRSASDLVRAAEAVLRATKDPRQAASQPGIAMTWSGFQLMASEFFGKVPDLGVDEVEALYNELSTAYVRMEGTDLEIEQAAHALTLATVDLIASGARR